MKGIIGAICGDIVGSVNEFNPIKTKDFKLFRKRSVFTDDTIMTLAVANWLIKDKNSCDVLIRELQYWGNMYPNAGYGSMFSRWIKEENPKPYGSWANGSAMRVSPCAWVGETLEEVQDLAYKSAAVTHNHPEGIKGALAVAECVFICKTATSIEVAKDEIRRTIPQKYGYDLNRTLDEIRPRYQFDVSCQSSVPEAIIAFLESTSLEDCVRNAISIGGDSDTIAAIACSIYATKNSQEDDELRKQFDAYLSPDLRDIMIQFEQKTKDGQEV